MSVKVSPQSNLQDEAQTTGKYPEEGDGGGIPDEGTSCITGTESLDGGPGRVNCLGKGKSLGISWA